MLYWLLFSLFLSLVEWSVVFFVKQKTAYEMRISDWSSDVCSSDLAERQHRRHGRRIVRTAQGADAAVLGLWRQGRTGPAGGHRLFETRGRTNEIGSASCRERVGQYV